MTPLEWAGILQSIAMLDAAIGGLLIANRAVTQISIRTSAKAESHTHYHGVEIPRSIDDADEP